MRKGLALISAMLITLLIAGPVHAGLGDGLVAYYPFSGGANDATGNGNHGIVHNAVPTMDRFGNNYSAYDFNGVNSYIEISALIIVWAISAPIDAGFGMRDPGWKPTCPVCRVPHLESQNTLWPKR